MPCRAPIAFALLFSVATTATAQDSAAADVAALRAWLAPAAGTPSAEELPGLLDRVVPLLASPDPALRDDLAFTLLARWIVREPIVPEASCRQLLARWLAALQQPAAAPADAVAGRSFAVLCLSLLAARDLQQPWLRDEEFAGLVTAAGDFLRRETDVRGFDARLGWLHSVAHTADLLKFLGRSPRLTPAQQAAMLGAIGDKLAAVDVPLVHGEDERLARALLSLLARTDADTAAFAAWAGTAFAPPAAAAPTAAGLARDHNRRHLLLALHGLLTVDERSTDGLAAAREVVHAALQRWLR